MVARKRSMTRRRPSSRQLLVRVLVPASRSYWSSLPIVIAGRYSVVRFDAFRLRAVRLLASCAREMFGQLGGFVEHAQHVFVLSHRPSWLASLGGGSSWVLVIVVPKTCAFSQASSLFRELECLLCSDRPGCRMIVSRGYRMGSYCLNGKGEGSLCQASRRRSRRCCRLASAHT